MIKILEKSLKNEGKSGSGLVLKFKESILTKHARDWEYYLRFKTASLNLLLKSSILSKGVDNYFLAQPVRR